MAGGTAGDGDRDGAGARLAASAELEQSVELGRALVTDAVPTSSPRAAGTTCRCVCCSKKTRSRKVSVASLFFLTEKENKYNDYYSDPTQECEVRLVKR